MEADSMKGETMGRSDLASSVPVAGSNNRWHRVGGEAAKTHIDKRTNDAAYHLVAERRGRNFEPQER
jgi:hypothetical protein